MSFSRTGTCSFKRRKRSGFYVASNNYFDPATCQAYSYDWWCYVKKIKGKVVFNRHRYSVSTNKHQSNMRGLLHDLGIEIDLEVNTRSSLSSFESAALPGLYTELFEAETVLSRKGSKQATIDQAMDTIKSLKADIKLARKLGAKFRRESIKALRESIARDEVRRLERLRDLAIKRREMEKQARDLFRSGTVINLDALGAA